MVVVWSLVRNVVWCFLSCLTEERKQQQINDKTKEIAYDEEMLLRPIYDTMNDKDI